mmetsp:Transcript_27148/g.57053  ORF Transcript_27148/g.57053 Transcript_27148/m.57053 type:complete len:700 (-) Transcript_27148:94-2193(-)
MLSIAASKRCSALITNRYHHVISKGGECSDRSRSFGDAIVRMIWQHRVSEIDDIAGLQLPNSLDDDVSSGPMLMTTSTSKFPSSTRIITRRSSSPLLFITTHHGNFKAVPNHNRLRHFSTIDASGGPSTASNSKYNNNNNPNDLQSTTGEISYQAAILALQNAKHAKQSHEERLLREQYEAMEKQQQKRRDREKPLSDRFRGKDDDSSPSKAEDVTSPPPKDRAAGMAIVKTIVKQSRREHKREAVKIETWSGSNAQQDKKDNEDSVDTIEEGKEEKDEAYYRKMARKYMEEAAFRYGHPLALVRLANEALGRAKSDGSYDGNGKDEYVDLVEICRVWKVESLVGLDRLIQLLESIDNNDKMNGYGLDQDHRYLNLQMAMHLYEVGGKRGSSEAWFNLGHLQWDGFVVNAEHASVVESNNSLNRDTGDKMNDDQIRDQQLMLLEPNKAKAMESFRKAIALGDADAMYFVGAQYLACGAEDVGGGDDETETCSILTNTDDVIDSIPSTQDNSSIATTESPSFLSNDMERRGYQLLSHAAHQHDHGPALHHLALLHYQHQDANEFKLLLSKAASIGHPDSLFLQGHCHYSGSDGYDQNYRKALENFVEAAEGGHVDAMVSAGALLHRGVRSEDVSSGNGAVVERDQRKAFELYQKAGELGSVEGWRNVVACYATGEGVPKCLDTARYIAKTMLKDDDDSQR